MHRRYRDHDVRKVVPLEGVWDFTFLGDIAPDAVDVTTLVFDGRMAVPGCFDATPAYAGKRGLAAYRREVSLPALAGPGVRRLVLDAVHHWCRVFIEGVPVGDHAGGFTRFAVDLPEMQAETAELVILVDNRFDPERSPLHQEYFDWYHFGGIARGAELQSLPSPWIERVQVDTVSIAPPTLRIAVTYGCLDVAADGDVAGEVGMTVTLDGRDLLSESMTPEPSGGTLVRTVTVPDAALWSPDAPNLHIVAVRLGEDDLRTRIGIRQVTVESQQILINGMPVRLLGFNRHAAHPEFGHAVPAQIQVTDLQHLRALGANFVRGSHYPQDDRFLDLCDEAGLCVWSEAIGWQHTVAHLTDEHFVAAQLEHIDEMVAAAYNHPSVIMWGILNESHSHDPACRPAYEALLGRVRALDSSRPLTYASNHPFEDVCLDLVDIVSVNCYPGWYGSEIARIPEEIDRIVAHLDAHGQAAKPLIISEIGAGAIYGWRDQNGARWSESYQARLLAEVIRTLFVDRTRAAGLAIWQFCDIRSSEAVQKILGRPRGFNNKGVVDEYRRPKEAYTVVQRAFRALHNGG